MERVEDFVFGVLFVMSLCGFIFSVFNLLGV